jgi:hypothetical protein
VSVEAEHEKEGEVMRIPERFKALGADFVMSSGVHEDQNEEHEVARNTAWLRVVNVESLPRSDLGSLHVEEIDVVCGGMYLRELYKI